MHIKSRYTAWALKRRMMLVPQLSFRCLKMSLRGKTRFARFFLCGGRNSTSVYAMRSVCSEVNVATAGYTGKKITNMYKLN